MEILILIVLVCILVAIISFKSSVDRFNYNLSSHIYTTTNNIDIMRATSEEVSCKIDDIRDSMSFLERNEVQKKLEEISAILSSVDKMIQNIEHDVDDCKFHLNK